MKLSDLSITNQQKQAVLESFLHQHYKLRITSMDLSKVRKVLEDVEQKKLNFIDSTPNYHTNKDYTKLALVSEALKIMLKELAPARRPRNLSESALNEEQDLNQAELILAAKDIVANLQDLAEDIAKDQVDDLMPLVSRMKETFGIDQAEQFETAASAALDSAMNALKQAHDDMMNAVLVLSGEQPAAAVPAVPGTDGEPGGDITGDQFGGLDAASGPVEEPLGREEKGE